MSRIPLSLHIGDVSALAKSLRKQLEAGERVPSHVEMLNLLAKAGGYKNFQHLKAEQEKMPAAPAADISQKRVRKAAGYFDLEGRLTRWPTKLSLQELCIWVMWSKLPARTSMTELDVDERLMLGHTFCDHAILRRFLVGKGLLSRTPDGSEYKRVEARPHPEAMEVLRRVR